MLNIGCHLSSSKGFLAMGKTALSIGANTLYNVFRLIKVTYNPY